MTNRILKKLALFGCVVASLIGSYNIAYAADEKQFLITDINVKGLYRVTKGAVLLSLPISVGDRVTREDISKSLKSVYHSSNFDEVSAKITDSGVLTVIVKERPTIVSVKYAGNNNIKEEQIDEIIKAQGVKVGEILNIQKLHELENSLEDYYNSMGRYQAKVKTILVYLPRNRVDVKFSFTEGVRAEIEQINIVGNKVFTESKLLSLLELRDSVPWWNFIADRKFEAQKFNADLETLRSYYMNRGYVRFNVDSSRIELSPTRKGVYVSISISEGEQYKLNKFKVIGETFGHTKEMEAIIPLLKDDIYNAAQIAHTEEILANFLSKYGYAYTKVRAVPIIDDEKKIVDLNFMVEPGKRIYVTDVKITGNTITVDEVIRREIRQMDGSWLLNESIKVSKRRLNQLGFFDTADVTPKPIGFSGDTVEVVANVKERPTGSIKAGIGYGTETGLSLNGEISQDNFLGYGGKGSIGINTNKYNRKIDLSYNEPFLTLDGVSLGANIYHEYFKAGDANLIDYKNKKYGLNVTLGYPLDEHKFISYFVGYEHNQISQVNSFYQVQKFWDIYIENRRHSGEVVFENFDTGVNFTRNYLDRGVFPTEGNKQRLNFMFTIPGSDTQYYKVGGDTTHFFPLDRNRRFIFNVRGKVAYGNGYGTKNGYDQILPFFENYYLGGDEWLRGFKYNSAGPKALYFANINGNNYTMPTDGAVGGNAIAAASFQLIVPTPFASEGSENSVRTSLFFDIGSVWDTTFDKDLLPPTLGNNGYLYDYSDYKKYRASAGLTFIWMSPMGPLGFSLAKPVKEYDGDDTEFFSFTMGRTF
ncbi:MAG: outer membrane protein assembly factor BamA [Ruminobacter sp.]|nr:outer membrane protein assembly factor BamA [Ruminobacter sp.]